MSVAVLALFAVAGAAVVGDYGGSMNAGAMRRAAAANLEYILGDDDALSARDFDPAQDRYYGMAFEAPLLLAERALGLDGNDSTAHLLRHSATHLFWLCGGFACFLLARRLFGGGPLALLAMLLFLLHPRLYAHAFFNSKDVSFLSMFMIALYLVHRAFEKDTVRAFVVLGMGTAVLTNLRIMGLMLVPAVLGMRACDLLRAAQWSGRRRVLTTAGAFAAAWAATLYAVSPYLWSDPREFAEAFRTLYKSHAPLFPWQLFQGRMIRADDLPWRYVPTWMAVTTPPFTLLLGCVGVAGVAWRAAAHPGRALRNTPLRFGLLLIVCLASPPLAVAALGAHTYDGWRHLYFLHAPFSLLAAFGLRLLTSHGSAWARRGAYAAAGVAAAGVAICMASMHPHQYVYFNFLVDRTTPERLRTQYDMDYWGRAGLDALRHLARTYPPTSVCLTGVQDGWRFLPEAQRKTIDRRECRGRRSDFVVSARQDHELYGMHPPETYAPEVWARKVYGSTIASIYGLNPALLDDSRVELHLDRFRETHRSLTQGAPAARARYDVRFDAARGVLTYARAPCVPADLAARFFLHVVPVDAGDLPAHHVRNGYDNRDFDLPPQALFDGKCLAAVRLPEYAVDHVRTGQTARKDDVWTALWEETIRVNPLRP